MAPFKSRRRARLRLIQVGVPVAAPDIINLKEDVALCAVVLVVDDLPRPRKALAAELQDAGFDVVEARDGEEAWECFCDCDPTVVITDMVMPSCDGLTLLERIRSRSDVPVVLFTARGSVSHAATAFKSGADEFVASDEVRLDELVALVKRAASGHRNHQSDALTNRLVGASAAMQRVRDRITGLSPLMTPVLILGEEGTGRDTVATAIHELGASGTGPLIHIDARSSDRPSGLPKTGALYFDGIDLLPANEQRYWAKQLLDGRSSLRLIASSLRPIAQLAESGEFSRDLANPLLRFQIELPALRSRATDVPELADHLTARLSSILGRKQVRLSKASHTLLASRRWPGNVAQLSRVLEQAIAFTRGKMIRASLLSEILSETEESLDRIREDHVAHEHRELVDAIRKTGGNISHAAAILGKSRGAVYRLIDKHGIPLVRASRR